MCGIFLCLDRKTYQHASDYVQACLSSRGPDSITPFQFEVKSTASTRDRQQNSPDLKGPASRTTYISGLSSVLSLRGDVVSEQPCRSAQAILVDSQTSFLCWNGEAWTFGSSRITDSDSKHVYTVLSEAASAAADLLTEKPEQAIAEVLSSYKGPYAFVFYDDRSRRLYFGRDFLGRRSLLYRQAQDGCLAISSVADIEAGWQEVDADGIYWINIGLGTNEHDDLVQRTVYHLSWQRELRLREDQVHSSITSSADHGINVDTLHHLLLKSLRPRLQTIPHRHSNNDEHCQGPATRVAVLFSGGIDCSLLARLADDILAPGESIDLLNVAFENPRVHGHLTDRSESPYELCPDRVTAQSSLKELRAACPLRHWRCLRVNVPYAEFIKHRSKIVALIKPHNTEMDLSIAAALYFASRGIGVDENGDSRSTTARVLLSGLGADELFAGYTRHATAFSRGGLSALEQELVLDVSRLGKRNLGRDDRVISNWAKEARYPFLDEELVAWALSLPISRKCGFGQTFATDDPAANLDPAKLILRRLALKLGLPGIANEKKRAVGVASMRITVGRTGPLIPGQIQFGARTAKMEAGRTKGTHTISEDRVT